MAKSRVDLILHPLRMRIMLAAAGRQITAGQLAEILPEVPTATLYRQLNVLVEGGVLCVVETRQVRGAMERTYALGEATIPPEALATATPEEHLRYFTTFVLALLHDFGRYLRTSDPVDLLADGVGYRQTILNLSDEEFGQFVMALQSAVLPFAANPPSPERRRRIFSTVVMPEQGQRPATSPPPEGPEEGG